MAEMTDEQRRALSHTLGRTEYALGLPGRAFPPIRLDAEPCEVIYRLGQWVTTRQHVRRASLRAAVRRAVERGRR